MKTPYYVLYTEKIKKNYRELEQSCKKALDRFKIVYSTKTNTHSAVLDTLSKQGSGFEVASLDEIKQISNKAFTIFNGPCKTEQELKIAIKNKFLINVDSKSEIDKISKLTKGKRLDIGLRVSLKNSKFGIEPRKAMHIINYAKSKGLIVICLHFHQGTQLSLINYEKNLKSFATLIKRLYLKPRYIDIGGGFPDKQQLKNLNKELEDYLSLIKKHLTKFDSTIILEPGRYLVADTMELITKVHVIKENFGKKYAILDAGINLLPKITLANYKFTIPKGQTEYLLAGPLLFNNDIIGKVKGNLKQRDIIKVENIGAYCYNLAWEISYKKPKIIVK